MMLQDWYTFDDAARLVTATYEITGKTQYTASDFEDLFISSCYEYPEIYEKNNVDLKEFCQIYIEEAEAEGIKAEVAFSQMLLETGWLQFGGDVAVGQFNFAGLGATGNGNPGNSFPDIRTGIRAHIQHLKAYANNQPLNNDLVDTRFTYVERGCAPYVEWLGQQENPKGLGWATSPGYGNSILKIIERL